MAKAITRASLPALLLLVSSAAVAQTPVPTPGQEQIQTPPAPPLPDLTRLGVAGDNVLALSMDDTIRRALESNNDIEVARGDVRVAEQRLRALYGVYDPVFSVTPSFDQRVTPATSVFSGAGASGRVSTKTFNFNSALSKYFETGGGAYELQFNNARTTTSATNSTLSPYYSSALTLLYTQPLLRNRSIDASRHAIRVQKKVLSQTDADFRRRTIEIISQAQGAYWNLVFALRNQQNQLESLNVSRQNLKNVEAQIAAGTMAPLDRAQVLTDIATREANLLEATQGVTTAENSLKRLLLKDSAAPEWSAQITPTDTPALDMSPVDLDGALEEARQNRPELSRLNLQKEINSIDVQYYRNQTRPEINLTGSVTSSGLAGDQVPCGAAACPAVPSNYQGGYFQSLSNISDFKTREINVGVTISLPLRNRAAKANLATARVQKEQNEASYRSQEQTVAAEVRNAAQAVAIAQKRIVASRLARESAEQQLAGEQKLYNVGRSTTFLLLQRQNELTAARTNELQAETDYSKALADLQRATASTLRANNVTVQSLVEQP
ncbi:MAG: TolC family protein [Acidobacteria bacterium]|nr:TolC family protein [Acidobacteriota bacterium]